MGLDPKKIKYLAYFLDEKCLGFGLKDISVKNCGEEDMEFFERDSKYSDFYVVDQWREIKYNEKEKEI